jgi:peptidoglycan/xylan/chitin deacetylase (PgdA/CDA1 family)
VRGKRQALVAAGWALGIPRLLLAARRLQRPPRWLAVLNYHRVNSPAAAAELDSGVLDATPEDFEAQMRALCRHLTPISLDELLAWLDGRPLPPNPVLVTFDDGYLDNLEVAVPILRRCGIVATFFIASRYVSERRLFWWDRLSWTVKNARRRRFVVDANPPIEIDLDEGIPTAERQLQLYVKRQPGLSLEAFLDALAAAAEAPWNAAVEAAIVGRTVMTWDQVRALRHAGMHVGSHTRTHRVLQTVPPAELESELAGSRADLEAQLRESVRVIAYPVGRPIADTPAIRAAVAAAGYTLGFSYQTGMQRLSVLDPLDVHRLGVDGGESASRVLARVAAPRLFR